MSMIEDIKRDREGMPDGGWFSLPMQGPRAQNNFARVFATDDDLRYIADCRDTLNFHSKTDNETNARRIARVPSMEAALLAAEELADAVDEWSAKGRTEATAAALNTALGNYRAATEGKA